jgi:hypothetical protein
VDATVTTLSRDEIPVLLRGEAGPASEWVREWRVTRVLLYVAIIVAGAGLFGAAIGCWRAPLQGFYSAIKFPLVVLLTALGNALLNSMLAPLLGLNLNLRQSLLAVLMSFTIAAAVLGAFSPLMFFIIWNTPPLVPGAPLSTTAHSFILVTEVAIIALAGIAANLRLLQLLQTLSGSESVARRVMVAWLAMNLLLGSQLSWNLRPFVGSPFLPVEFLRGDAFSGGFFESILHAMTRLFFS